MFEKKLKNKMMELWSEIQSESKAGDFYIDYMIEIGISISERFGSKSRDVYEALTWVNNLDDLKSALNIEQIKLSKKDVEFLKEIIEVRDLRNRVNHLLTITALRYRSGNGK